MNVLSLNSSYSIHIIYYYTKLTGYSYNRYHFINQKANVVPVRSQANDAHHLLKISSGYVSVYLCFWPIDEATDRRLGSIDNVSVVKSLWF